jgi:hypothetical protein
MSLPNTSTPHELNRLLFFRLATLDLDMVAVNQPKPGMKRGGKEVSPKSAIASNRFWGRLLIIITLVAVLGCMTVAKHMWAQNVGQSDTVLYQNVHSYVDLTPDELTARIPDLKGFVPAASKEDAEKVLPVMLGQVGANIERFFAKFPNVTAREVIIMEGRGPKKNAVSTRQQTSNYLAVSQADQGVTTLREYRTDTTGKSMEPSGLQEGMATTKGFASMAILFHPEMRSDALFRYLGRQNVDGKDTDLVVFAQRPGWAQPNVRINLSGRTVTLLVQGLAWIDPSTYRIIRLRTDLLAPRPDLGLIQETTDITYEEVGFPEMPGTVLSLPKVVRVAIAWEQKTKISKHEGDILTELPSNRGTPPILVESSNTEPPVPADTKKDLRTYHNTHQYSDYKLFSAERKLSN